MSNSRALTTNRKKSALMRCDDIAAALRSLAMEVLNNHANISDVDHALKLMDGIHRLRRNIEGYPAIPELPEQERIDELISYGFRPKQAKVIAAEEVRTGKRIAP